MMRLDQLAQLKVMHRPVVEVGAQGQQDDEWATRLCHSGYEQVNEVLAFLLGQRLGEQFFKLVDHEHDFDPRSFDQLGGKQVEATGRVVFQVVKNGPQTPLQ